MIIKPIKLIPTVPKGEIPETKINKQSTKSDGSFVLTTGKWQFTKGVLMLDGRNITQLIENEGEYPAGFWSAVSHDLDEFRNKYIREKIKKNVKKKGDEVDPDGELGHLSAIIDAYIGKILRILKRKYDETKDGMAFNLDEEGQLTINGMNVTAFIDMARYYPTDKARVFLKGLKNRLGIILSNKSSSPSYDKIHDIVLSLFKEIDAVISKKSRGTNPKALPEA